MKKKKDSYKSDFERKLHKGPLKTCRYEPWSVEYKVSGDYTPDFVPQGVAKLHERINVFEAKGRFRDYAEPKKYLAVAKDNPHLKIIFIFQNPNGKAYAQCKRRKDGTFLTLAEWAERHGFEWYTKDTIPKELLK